MRPNRRGFLKMLGAAGLSLGPGVLARADNKPVAVEFWDMRNGPGTTYKDAGRRLAARYEAEVPGIQVNYQTEEWADWPQLFYLAVSTGSAPDLSTGGSYQAIQFYDMGEILPLDDLIADMRKSGEDKDFPPGTLDYMLYKGHTVALPWAIDIRVIYYRKDLFAKAGIDPPRSWDELRAAARALTSGGQYGCVLPGSTIRGTHTLFLLMLNNNGGLYTPDGQVELRSDRNLEAFQYLADLAKDGSFNPDTSKFTPEQAEKAFLSGGGAILFDAPGMEKLFPDQIDKIGLLEPPAGPHGDKGTIRWTPNIMLYKQGKHPKEAKALLRWWSANQKTMWTEGHCSRLPVRSSIASDPYFQNDPVAKQILDQWVPVGKGPGTHKAEVFPGLNDLEGYGPMTLLLQDLLAGKDVNDSTKVAEARLKALMKNGQS